MRKSKVLLFSIFFSLFFANTSSAAICDSNSTVLCNPTHAVSIEKFIGNILTAAGVIIGILAIIMLVYSGFRMIVSQGKEEEVTKAKRSFRWTIGGFILAVFAFVLVSAIGQFFGATDITPTTGTVVNPIQSSGYLALSTVIFNGVATVIGLIAILYIIINGFWYLTARGNDEQTLQAKQGLQWAIIGLAVVLLAYVIIEATAQLINAPIK